MKPNKRVKNILGMTFGKLTVQAYLGTDFSKLHKIAKWECLCECGKTIVLGCSPLMSGNTKSCGCLRKETTSKNHVLPSVRSSLNKLYAGYINGAKSRGLDFDVSFEEFVRLTSLNCFYCGISPSTVYKGRRKSKSENGDYRYNGLDRIDSSIGYTLNNVVPCCKHCNYAKRQMTYKEFKDWIFSVNDHLLSKNILTKSLISV